MTKLYIESANAYKRSKENVVVTATGKFLEAKIDKLQEWYYVMPSTDCGLLLIIQEETQQAADKEEFRCVLQKHFDNFNKTVEDTINAYFDDRLIKYVMKLQVSPSRNPDEKKLVIQAYQYLNYPELG